jgi:linoleoyl-CoA desaturase
MDIAKPQDTRQSPQAQPVQHGISDRRMKFDGDIAFQREVRRRVEEYFDRSGRRQRDCWQMYLKAAVHLSVFAAAYVLLVFVARTWWQALPLSILLGLVTAGIGFNVQHDGGHDACSSRPAINRLMAMTLDLIGGSSYLWRWKHAVFHHTYVNITGEDTDIDLGVLGRVSPHQRRFWFHRWQHIYLWPFYGFLAISWQLYGDFQDVILGRIGRHQVARPGGWQLVIFLGGKLAFFSLAFAIPMLVHSVWVVLLYYAVTALVTGIVLSVVFQLAHCVEEAEFPMPGGEPKRIERAWAIHQVETTVDFARRNRLAAWLLGGLNFQIEHHLFPRICHINYPALSAIVEETCRDFGIRYSAHSGFWSGVASHYRWLRKVGAAPAGA